MSPSSKKGASMRMLVAAVIFAAAFSDTAFAQTAHDVSLRVEDLSPQGSPISCSGSVSFHVVASANAVQTQLTYSLTATNVSSKPILAYEFSLTAIADYGSGELYTRQRDYFFVPESLLMPGSQDFDQHVSGTINVVHAATNTPKADLAVLFVEFADGTTFGRSKWGDSLIGSREPLCNKCRPSCGRTTSDARMPCLQPSLLPQILRIQPIKLP